MPHFWALIDPKPSNPYTLACLLLLIPQYQGVDLESIQFKRVLFGFFPTYRDSPLKPGFDRWGTLEGSLVSVSVVRPSDCIVCPSACFVCPSAYHVTCSSIKAILILDDLVIMSCKCNI